MTENYITDVAYAARFYDVLSPSTLAYVTALGGYAPPALDQPFRYCELGCGNGFSTNILAGCYPHAEFVALDAHEGHIEDARVLAAEGGLRNATFLRENFTRLGELDLPEFDFITFQGVWSWVGDDIRETLAAFLAAKLRPGGIVMASYNCLPGWAPIEPLRRMMLAFMERCEGSADERAGQAITYLKFLRDNGAAFFRDNPAASKALDEMARTERCFVVHDYLPPSMTPFYFADVAEALDAAGLAFAGGSPVFRNYPKFSAAPEFADFLACLEDRAALERQLDIIANTRFRTDVFVKPAAAALNECERARLLEPMRFGSLEARDAMPPTAELGRYSIAYSAPIYGPLMDCLAQGAPSVDELARSNELGGFSGSDIVKAVNLLVLGGHFRPFAAPASDPSKPPVNGVLGPLNRALLARQREAADPVFLASPVVGSGVPVPPFAALIFEALDSAGRAGAPDAVWRRLEARGQSLEGDGGALAGRDAHLTAIGAEIDALRQERRGKLVELQIADLPA